jgi:DNA adenine methylase
VPVSESANFTTYNQGGFTLDDQKRLADVFKRLHQRGCMLMLSNSSTQVVRELYADFHITEVSAPRSINSDTSARGNVPEVVVRNYNNEARADVAA